MLSPIPSSYMQPGVISTLWRESHEAPSGVQGSAKQVGRPTSEMSDEELLDRHFSGCPESFGMLIERHRRVCLSVAIRILRNPAAAEDEVQTAVMKAYAALHTFNGQARFSSWLKQIVTNQCRMRLRMERRRRTDLSDETVLQARCGRRTQEEAFAASEVIALVRREILLLPTPLRDVLRSVLLEGRTPCECSVQLGLTRAAVKSRLLRARREFGLRMQRYHGAMGGLTLLR